MKTIENNSQNIRVDKPYWEAPYLLEAGCVLVGLGLCKGIESVKEHLYYTKVQIGVAKETVMMAGLLAFSLGYRFICNRKQYSDLD